MYKSKSQTLFALTAVIALAAGACGSDEETKAEAQLGTNCSKLYGNNGTDGCCARVGGEAAKSSCKMAYDTIKTQMNNGTYKQQDAESTCATQLKSIEDSGTSCNAAATCKYDVDACEGCTTCDTYCACYEELSDSQIQKAVCMGDSAIHMGRCN